MNKSVRHHAIYLRTQGFFIWARLTGLTRLRRRILSSFHMGNFISVDWDKFKQQKLIWFKNVESFASSYRSFVDSCNLSNKDNSHTSEVEIHARHNYAIFGRSVAKVKLFCQKKFSPVAGMECLYVKILSPVAEILVGKTEIPATEPAHPLIWTLRNFYKRFSCVPRSRKPGQPGQLGSYEKQETTQDL